MGMVICSISDLKRKHELAKKYECYSDLVVEQARILAEIEESMTSKVDVDIDETCLESYEYSAFSQVKEPQELLMNLVECFGAEVMYDSIKSIINERKNNESLKGKFYTFRCEDILDETLYPDYKATLINFDMLDDKDKEDIILSMDFEINKHAVRENLETNNHEDLGKPCWKLIDTQGGNLADIESDEFDQFDYNSILDRLNNYYHDYGYYFVYEMESMNVPYKILEETTII